MLGHKKLNISRHKQSHGNFAVAAKNGRFVRRLMLWAEMSRRICGLASKNSMNSVILGVFHMGWLWISRIKKFLGLGAAFIFAFNALISEARAFTSPIELSGSQLKQWLSEQKITVLADKTGTNRSITVRCPPSETKGLEWVLQLTIRAGGIDSAIALIKPHVVGKIESKEIKGSSLFRMYLSEQAIEESHISLYLEVNAPEHLKSGPHILYVIRLKDLTEIGN